jgi:hypothetical protein
MKMRPLSRPNFPRLLPLLAAALFIAHPDQAAAAIAVSNLANAGNVNLNTKWREGSGEIRANSFTTGSSATSLTSVTLPIDPSFSATGVFSRDLQ